MSEGEKTGTEHPQQTGRLSVTATTTDASGVTRTAANLVIAQGGSPATLIAGASDAALS